MCIYENREQWGPKDGVRSLVVASHVPLELTTDLLTLQEQETETSLQSEYVFLSVIFKLMPEICHFHAGLQEEYLRRGKRKFKGPDVQGK